MPILCANCDNDHTFAVHTQGVSFDHAEADLRVPIVGFAEMQERWVPVRVAGATIGVLPAGARLCSSFPVAASACAHPGWNVAAHHIVRIAVWAVQLRFRVATRQWVGHLIGIPSSMFKFPPSPC